jgi:hypothetical protein
MSYLSAQTVVIGHVSAEVVEAVSVSSNVITNLTIENIDSEQNAFDLGNITISSGSRSSCYNVVVKPATVASESGKTFTLTPKTCLNSTPQNRSDNCPSNKTLAIKGSISQMEACKTDIYKGSYTIILAYN